MIHEERKQLIIEARKKLGNFTGEPAPFLPIDGLPKEWERDIDKEIEYCLKELNHDS